MTHRRIAAMFFVGVLTLLAIPRLSYGSPEQLKVLVTLPAQAWIVRSIAGTAATVTVLISQNVNHHTFEPTMEQMKALRGSDLYLRASHPALQIEKDWLKRAAAENPKLVVNDITKNVELMSGDPHFWLSTSNMKIMIGETGKILAARLPARGSEISQRTEALLAKVTELGVKLREKFRGQELKRFIVFHPAWGYLASEVGIQQMPLESQGKEPSPQEIMAILSVAKRMKIKTIFTEPTISPASALVAAKEIDGKVEVLNPMAEDWDANLERSAEKIFEAVRNVQPPLASEVK